MKCDRCNGPLRTSTTFTASSITVNGRTLYEREWRGATVSFIPDVIEAIEPAAGAAC
jgi:hypothetical protein